MGSIRVLLAVAVVFEHAYGTAFSGGVFAVQLFFVVSGFFISYILVESQNYGTIGAFYWNRILRLFPVYWTVALASLVMYLGGAYAFGNAPPFVEVYQQLDLPNATALALTNVFLFGQDWVIFTAIDNGALVFSPNYHVEDVWVWRGLLVPPAWSLGIELTFYLIAPFILTRLRLLLVLLIFSVALRLWLISTGLGLQDPWNYRFFPTELALFILGILSHQLWKPYLEANDCISDRIATAITLIVIVVTAVCVTLHILPLRLPVLVLFVLSLPFLFCFQKNRPWDRWLGEFSYPIYIVHWSVMFPVSHAWDRYSNDPGYQGMDETAAILVLTLIGAYVLKKFVSEPVENVRDGFRKESNQYFEVVKQRPKSPSDR